MASTQPQNSRPINVAIKAYSSGPFLPHLSFSSLPTNSPATETFLHSLNIICLKASTTATLAWKAQVPELWLYCFFWSTDSILNATSSEDLPWPPKVTCYLNILF